MRYLGMSHNQLFNLIKEPIKHTAFIVFFDTGKQSELDKQLLHKLQTYPSLNLFVDDVSKDIDSCKEPTKQDVTNIINYINNNESSYLIVSCTAGISRTGAVIHYLDELTHTQNNWKMSYDNELKLNYFANDKYLPNITLDKLLQEHLRRDTHEKTYLQ